MTHNINNNSKGYSQKYLRQRKFLLAMPLFVIPLVTFLLWSTGLVGNKQKDGNALLKSNGLNMTLPGAGTAKDSSWSKLNFYEAADKEAARRASLAKSDPYYQLSPLQDQEIIDTNLLPVATKKRDSYDADSKGSISPYSVVANSNQDPNEVKVYQKLNELNKALAENDAKAQDRSHSNVRQTIADDPVGENEINKLEAMMKQVDAAGSNSVNPEMEQINSMLEKILDIQHPERVKGKFVEKQQPAQPSVLKVSASNDAMLVSTLQPQTYEARNDTANQREDSTEVAYSNRFYSLDDEPNVDERRSSLIEAVVPEVMNIVSGSIVKLQLLSDVYVQNVLIPKGTFVFGEAALNNERLKINIKTVKCQDEIVPISLSVYDQDGLEGIYTPGAITRDVAKQSSDQSLQSMSLASLDNSLGAQAASAGIQAAKSLIGKKAKLVRVNISAGYRVILRESK
jgi:conjugative transposon TraM protein